MGHGRKDFSQGSERPCASGGQHDEHSRFAAVLACPLDAVPEERSLFAPEPFTRRATGLLMRSLDRLVSAIESAVALGTPLPFPFAASIDGPCTA